MNRRVAPLLAALVAIGAAACTPTQSADVAGGPSPAAVSASPSEKTGETASPPGPSREPSREPSRKPEPDPRSLTVAMNGDVLLHEGLWATARVDAARTGRGVMDFRPLLSHVAPVVRDADLAICHLETPVGAPFSGYPVFSVPPQIVPALRWAGFDACTTASNHSVDRGFEGIERTAEALDAAGLARTGANVSEKESRRARFLLVDGVEVALISATYGLNGLPLPEGKPWAVNLIDTDQIIRKATLARRTGADLVLVALHWGDEYVTTPSAYQRDVATTLARSGKFDLVYGHHSHVVQPYDKVAGTWVLYGQGNAIAQQETDVPGLYDGNLARVTFTEKPSGRFELSLLEFLPTQITRSSPGRPMRYLDAGRAVQDPRFRTIRDDLRATISGVRAVIGSKGAFERGVRQARSR